MKKTPNYQLKKPEENEYIEINDINANMDKIDETLAGKVDKIPGKELSSNNYTDEEKEKLANVEYGATAVSVENSLTSDSATEALAAKQGKVLNELIEETKGDISDKLLDVKKIMENTLKGGILNALLTGFTRTSDSGDIVSSDTLKKALNKLQNKVKIVYGSYTGKSTYSDYYAQTIDVGIEFKALIIIGNTGGEHAIVINKSMMFNGQNHTTAYSMDIEISDEFNLVDNGFRIKYHRLNYKDNKYNYIAIG